MPLLPDSSGWGEAGAGAFFRRSSAAAATAAAITATPITITTVGEN